MILDDLARFISKGREEEVIIEKKKESRKDESKEEERSEYRKYKLGVFESAVLGFRAMMYHAEETIEDLVRVFKTSGFPNNIVMEQFRRYKPEVFGKVKKEYFKR